MHVSLNGRSPGALLLPLLVILASQPVAASAPARPAQGPEVQIRQADSAFWAAFERCDAKSMAALFTTDAEFYHDRTGLTVGAMPIAASMMRGPCGKRGERVTRRAVPSSIRFEPLAGGFGLLTGEHRFLRSIDGGAAQPSGSARFISLWQQSAGRWRMRRVVSFGHAAGVPELAPVKLSAAALLDLAGEYTGEGSALVRVRGDELVLTSGGTDFVLVPLAPDRFGVADRPLQFQFKGDTLIVMENGSVAARMRRVPRK
ncbi:DUF4440 domain-containing protein [Sphingomonas swuensis]|uniref:DUF4440 domain-containing protein n=1 Tax=Sphingomonas swuensis TaxID=977800 RepID=A0ABP7S763_9SPHN